MITIRKAEERGRTELGWLVSLNTFSFGKYHDLKHMGFESLKTINEDHVAPGGGFGLHPHENMEVISYVLEGKLEHEDNMGNCKIILPGDLQRMSAGTGLIHSEFNHSSEEKVHFIQIWIKPNKLDVKPSYDQKVIPLEEKQGKLRLIISQDGRDDSVTIHQDVDVYVALLDSDQETTFELLRGRKAWVQMARGSVHLNGHDLQAGDGAAIENEGSIRFHQAQGAEILLFDLAPFA